MAGHRAHAATADEEPRSSTQTTHCTRGGTPSIASSFVSSGAEASSAAGTAASRHVTASGEHDGSEGPVNNWQPADA